jgi:hypothetical protein
MAVDRKTYDVFVSYATRDASLALDIANACRASGLEAFTYTEIRAGENFSDALWEALAESRALLTILSPSGPTPTMAIEIGAARAWNKPIYAVVTDPSSLPIPSALSGIQLYTVGRIEDVIQAIKLGVQQLSEEDRSYLIQLYSTLGVPVDRLALDPKHLEELVRKFRAGRGREVSGERLLSELIRLRKNGKLVKNHARGRLRSHIDSV